MSEKENITEIVEESLSKREKWARLVNFLDKEIRILEETCLSEENKIHSFRRDSKNLEQIRLLRLMIKSILLQMVKTRVY